MNENIKSAVESYRALLNLYEDKVKILTEELNRVRDGVGVPSLMINSRMTSFDENLRDWPYYYQIKQEIIPLLIKHLAIRDGLSGDERAEFKQQFANVNLSASLNSLLDDFTPLPQFVDRKIEAEQLREDRFNIPSPPQRRNATRQYEIYRKKREEFENKRDVVSKNIEEMKRLKEMYLAFKKEI